MMRRRRRPLTRSRILRVLTIVALIAGVIVLGYAIAAAVVWLWAFVF